MEGAQPRALRSAGNGEESVSAWARRVWRGEPDEETGYEAPQSLQNWLGMTMAGMVFGAFVGIRGGYSAGKEAGVREVEKSVRQRIADGSLVLDKEANIEAQEASSKSSSSRTGNGRPSINTMEPPSANSVSETRMKKLVEAELRTIRGRSIISNIISKEIVRYCVMGGARVGLFVASYATADVALAEIRGRRDAFNTAGAGLFSGALFGLLQGGWRGSRYGALVGGGVGASLGLAHDLLRSAVEYLEENEEESLPPHESAPPPYSAEEVEAEEIEFERHARESVREALEQADEEYKELIDSARAKPETITYKQREAGE